MRLPFLEFVAVLTDRTRVRDSLVSFPEMVLEILQDTLKSGTANAGITLLRRDFLPAM